jgi:hypothetical protein
MSELPAPTDRWSGHTLRCLKVLSANENRAAIGFLDEARPGRSQTASQIAAFNNRREAQWGVSTRDRQAVLAAFRTPVPPAARASGDVASNRLAENGLILLTGNARSPLHAEPSHERAKAPDHVLARRPRKLIPGICGTGQTTGPAAIVGPGFHRYGKIHPTRPGLRDRVSVQVPGAFRLTRPYVARRRSIRDAGR